MADRHYTLRKPEGLLAHYTSAAVAFEDILPGARPAEQRERERRLIELPHPSNKGEGEGA